MRRIAIKRLPYLAALALLLGGMSFSASARDEVLLQPSLPAITNILQFHRLVRQEPRALRSFRLKGVVCAAVPNQGLLVLRDDSGAGLVEMDLPGQPLQPGQQVVLEGQECAAILSDSRLVMGTTPAPRLQVGAAARVPAPRRLAIGQVLAEEEECLWAEVEGTVTSVSDQAKGLLLELSAGNSRMRVAVADGSGLSPRLLLKSKIRALGVCQSAFTLDGQRVAGILAVPGCQEITPLELGATGKGQADLPSVLTTAGEIKRMRREEALRGYAVKIRGVVTCLQPEHQGIVIQDSTLGVYVKYDLLADLVAPRLGEYCEIEGVTDAGFAPMVRPRRIIRLGEGVLPEPQHPTWDQLMTGSLDTQYAELEGIVTAVEPTGVVLLTHGGNIKVGLPGWKPELLQRFENARVRLRGCLFAKHEDEKIALQVKVGKIELRNASVSEEEPAPADLFAAPLKTVADLLLFDPNAGAFQRVKAAGQIVHERQGEYFLMNGTNGLRFTLKATAGLQVADLVEVVGFPQLEGPSPVLREAAVRKTGQAALPSAIKLSTENLLGNDYDATLVQAEGSLVSLGNNGAEQVLEVQAGVRKFVARLKGEHKSIKAIPFGSRLQLTGVYAGRGGNRALGRNIDAFELLLNSPADVQVLARPPWWTLERLLGIVGVLLGGLAVAFVWISLLHRQVEQRTAQLKQEIEERERAEYNQALETERSRIARDLHDDLGSSLTEISMLAETGRDQAASAEDPRQRFDRILRRAHTLVRTLDEIVWAVDPRKDTLPALVRYLAGFAEEYVAAAGLACRVEMPPAIPESPLAAHVRHHLFLGVKEALNNAVRHARATHVVFQMSLEAKELNLTITDDGGGFDPAAATEGNGLANLRQRLAGLGGHCAITSRKGAGSTVVLALSLSNDSHSL